MASRRRERGQDAVGAVIQYVSPCPHLLDIGLLVALPSGKLGCLLSVTIPSWGLPP